jgi:hypothetical protein
VVHEEWLFAETIPTEMQPARSSIPDSKREHADEPAHGRLDSPTLERGQHYFGVRMTSEMRSAATQLSSEVT